METLWPTISSVENGLVNGRDDGSRWSLWSRDSVLSIGSRNSVLSVGSIGSVLSVGSIGFVGSILSIGSFWSISRRDVRTFVVVDDGVAIKAVDRWHLVPNP